jgi:hypothetical protein
MPDLSLETVTRLMRIAFLVGAVTDGVAIFPMLSQRCGVTLFGSDASRDSPEYRFAMRLGVALMAGWTLLLLWGAIRPIERRDLLLLTVFPVIAGIVWATAVAARRGVLRPVRVLPLWIHLGAVSVFYLVVYALSRSFAP